MALNSVFSSLRDKVENAFNNFFYPDGEFVGQHSPGARAAAPRQEAPMQAPQPDPYVNGAFSAQSAQNTYAGWQNPPAQNTQGYAPYQNPSPAQNALDKGYMQQPAGGAMNSGMDANARAPFPPFQQPAAQQPFQTQSQPHPAAQPRMDGNVVYLPNAQSAPVQDTFSSARVINARGVSDCYSAITQLRSGDMVVLVMENISDPAEMRHYVDMLSGACYSLRATITKLSRHGAYLICPGTVKVYVDAATNQLNSVSARQAQPRPTQNAYPGYDANYAYPQSAPNDPYQRRSASPDPNQTPYYSRAAAPDSRSVADTEKQIAGGYMPDVPMENAL